MEITSSYQVEILSNTDMKNTVQIYRRALAFVVDVCNKEWTDISSIEQFDIYCYQSDKVQAYFRDFICCFHSHSVFSKYLLDLL